MATITSTELGAAGRYINLGTPNALASLISFSCLVYCRPSSVGENNAGYMWAKCPSDGRGPRFFVSTDWKLNYGTSTGANLVPQRSSSSSRATSAAWQHVAVVHSATGINDLSASKIALFYESAGSLQQEATYSVSSDGAGVLLDDSAINAFLLNREGLGRAFVGDVAYVAVWNRPLSLAELNAAASDGPLDVPNGLVLLWANQQDLGPHAISPASRSAYVGGALPPNLKLGGSEAIAPAPAAVAMQGYAPEVVKGVAPFVRPSSGLVECAGYVPVVRTTQGVITISSPARGTLLLSACSVTENGLTPTITLRSRWAGDENASGARAMYGKVSGVAGMTPSFRLSRTGFEGTLETSKKFVFSYDRVTWHEFGNRTNDSSYFNFSHSAAFTSGEVWICSQEPWTNETTAQWISSVQTSQYVSEAPSSLGKSFVFGTRSASVNELGETIPALPLYSLKVGNSNPTAPDGQPKRKLVLMAGVHASEDIGNYLLEGAVEFLVSSDPKAAVVRDWFDTFVYPLIAAAGRYGGAQRADFGPGAQIDDDVNRKWVDGSVLEANNKHMLAISTDCGAVVDVLIDYHGNHLSYPNVHCFVPTGTDKTSFGDALSVYRPGIPMTDSTTIGTASQWATAHKGAVIACTGEYQYYKGGSYGVSDGRVFGADTLRAISDLASSWYFSTGPVDHHVAAANMQAGTTLSGVAISGGTVVTHRVSADNLLI